MSPLEFAILAPSASPGYDFVPLTARPFFGEFLSAATISVTRAYALLNHESEGALDIWIL